MNNNIRQSLARLKGKSNPGYKVEIKLFLVREEDGTYRHYFGFFSQQDIQCLHNLFRDRIYNRKIPVEKIEQIIKAFDDKYKEYKACETSILNGKQAYMLSSIPTAKLIDSINRFIDG